jgi:hypothetical protein
MLVLLLNIDWTAADKDLTVDDFVWTTVDVDLTV